LISAASPESLENSADRLSLKTSGASFSMAVFRRVSFLSAESPSFSAPQGFQSFFAFRLFRRKARVRLRQGLDAFFLRLDGCEQTGIDFFMQLRPELLLGLDGS
jgi:hypothetical protein